MKVGVCLFNKVNEVVYELDDAPKGIADVSMVVYKGVHYSYRSIHRVGENCVYTRFDESNPPYELV